MNILKLREKIKKRSEELNIRPAHDELGHHYTFGAMGPYDSVTMRLAVLKDPSIINYKMNRALEYVEANLTACKKENGFQLITTDAIKDMLIYAKLAPQLEFEGAGDIGTQVHNWREQWFTNIILEDGVSATLPGIWEGHEVPLAVTSACRAIGKFVKDTGYIPIACELYLADPKLRIGGTLDDIGIIGDDLCLIDLKTSNIGNKDSYYAQICLYLHMFRKLYRLYPKKIYILHVSKDNGTYELIPLHDRIDINKTINWAKQVVKVSQGLDVLRETKKAKVVIL